MGDPEYALVFFTIVMPVIRAFQPEFMFISAGESNSEMEVAPCYRLLIHCLHWSVYAIQNT